MEPMNFDDANRVFGAPADMPDCQPLSVQDDGQQLLSCWRPSWRERMSVLFYGRVWLCVAGNSHPPVWVTAHSDINNTASDCDVAQPMEA